MENNNLANMVKGWFIGDFEPSVIKTSLFEVALKTYKEGDYEHTHYHKVAKEITLISEGTVKMNGVIYNAGDIILLDPFEKTDFLCVSSTAKCVVVKYPSVKGDKYIEE